MDLISIIVPVYNVEKYIHQCVDSIINQTYKNIEIILVDDGSPDNCGKICDEYASKDSRIKVIHKPNGGLSDARNYGIDAARGDWLMFVDSDDWIDPDMAERLYLSAKKENADMSVCSVELFCDSPAVSLKTEAFYAKDALQSGVKILKTDRIPVIYVIMCNKLIKKELFNEIRFPVGRIHEDEAVAHRLLYLCNRIVAVDEMFYHYRQTPNSIMSSAHRPAKLDILLAYSDRIRFYYEIGLEEYTDSLQSTYYNMLINSYYKYFENPEYRAKLIDCKTDYRRLLPCLLKRSTSIKERFAKIVFMLSPVLYKKVFYKN